MKTVFFCLVVVTLTKLNAQDVSEVWQVPYGVLIDAYDEAKKVVTDDDGNIYVTGTTGQCEYTVGGDITTIKYSSTGNQLWLKVYDGLGKARDDAMDIALDESANVYVTGWTENTAGDLDFVTIKYNSDGEKQWTAVYDDPFHSWDQAQALDVDGNGNCYVTGTGVNDSDSVSSITIKYDSTGQQKWVATYNCGFNGGIFLADLKLDTLGNIYIAGSIEYTVAIYQYFVIKYSSDGVQQWISIYQDGTVHALTLDPSGNICVTGVVTPGSIGTIKYDSNGNQEWIAFFSNSASSVDFSNAITSDDEGNIFITGSSDSGNNPQMLTVKYNAIGQQQWKKLYGGGYYTNASYDVKADKNGSVFVTGLCYNSFNGTGDFTTIKYDSSGSQEWLSAYNGDGNNNDLANSLALDAFGNAVVTGWLTSTDGRKDYGTVKYSANGGFQWASVYNSHINGNNRAKDLATDDDGSIFVTGCGMDSLAQNNFTTIKYNSDGTQQWVGTYKGEGNSVHDGATAIGIDQNGNVFVTGRATNNSGNTDITTIKYDSSGNVKWIKVYNGTVNADDYSNDIAVDGYGNIYVAGNSINASGSSLTTIKYSNSGLLWWVAFYTGDFTLFKEATSIAVDDDGNVYVTGITNGGTGNGYTTIKYNSNGAQQWTSFFHTGNNSNYEKSRLTLDGAGNVYITGAKEDNNGSYDYVTIKYDGNGIQQWANIYSGSGNGYDVAHALVTDSEANVYVTGTSLENLSVQSCLTIKYSTSGVLLWTAQQSGNGTDIVIDDSGNLYTANAFITKYNSAGVEQWNLEASMGIPFAPVKLALDNSNNIYLTGTVPNGYYLCTFPGNDFLTVKLSQSITGISDEEWNSFPSMKPNPVNEQLNLQFTQPSSGSLLIMNTLGEKILKEEISNTTSVQLDVRGFPSGIYFLSIRDEKQNIMTKKFVKK